MEEEEKKAHIAPSYGIYLHSWETQTVLTCGSTTLYINNGKWHEMSLSYE